MVTLEQVRQLETKIGKAIDYVNRVNGENVRLLGELDGSQKRIAELEETVQRFREEQSRIEEGILAALDRLDQFEDAVNRGLSNVQAVVAAAAPTVAAYTDPLPAKPEPEAPVEEPPSGEAPLDEAPPDAEPPQEAPPGGEPSDDESPEEEFPGEEPPPDSEETGTGELDIF
jgi:FtsZ-binding cell division protein ZapB